MKIKQTQLVILILTLSLFFSKQAKTQGDYIEAKYSMPYKVVDAQHKFYFTEEDEILSVKINGDEVIMQKFSSEEPKFILEKEHADFPKGFSYESIRKIKDNYYLFYSVWDKKNKLEQLFYRQIDFKNAIFFDKGTLLIEVEGKVTGRSIGRMGFWSLGTHHKFRMDASKDGSKILFTYRKKPEEKRDSKSYDIIGFNVFDPEMNKIWSEEIKMPYTEKKMNNLDYSVDSKGDAYLLALVYEDNTTRLKDKKTGEANFHIELMKFEDGFTEIENTTVSLGDKFINSIWLFEKNDGKMICAGFYNNGKDLSDADGIFIFNVSKDGEASDISTHEIPVEVLNQYVSNRARNRNEKKDKKEKAEFEELVLKQMITDKDGNTILIGEQYFIIVHRYYDSKTHTYREYYTYHYNDILVTKLSKDGDLLWMKKLPKRQVGRAGQGGMSFEHIILNGKHWFFILDNVKNMKLPIDKYPAVHQDGRGGFITAFTVDHENGEVEKKSLVDLKKFQGMKLFQFFPGRLFKVSENEVIFEVYKKRKEDILIKLTLE